MPAKPISQFPDSTAPSRSGTLVNITNSGLKLFFFKMILATSMQKPLKSLKTRGGEFLNGDFYRFRGRVGGGGDGEKTRNEDQ
jgi:hypothetical protein